MAVRYQGSPNEKSDHERELEGSLHDVANALTVVLGWLDEAVDHVPAKSPAGVALQRARARAMHGRGIALRAMRTDGPRLPTPPSPCSVLIEDAASGVHPQAVRRNISIQKALEPSAKEIGVHSPTRALQVLTNLLMNAVAFTPRGKSVFLEAGTTSNGLLRFVVRDEGPGFTPAQVADVFSGLRSTREGGHGIGLAYAHEIASREGGDLRLIHAGPGAMFELVWPQEVITTGRAHVPSTASLDGLRVLLVEDDLALVMLLQTALGARGALVHTVQDAASLAQVLQRHSFDAALVDLSPLEPDVLTALLRMRATGVNRVILTTGVATTPAPEVLAQATRWVRKPFEILDVVTALLTAQ